MIQRGSVCVSVTQRGLLCPLSLKHSRVMSAAAHIYLWKVVILEQNDAAVSPLCRLALPHCQLV